MLRKMSNIDVRLSLSKPVWKPDRLRVVRQAHYDKADIIPTIFA